MIKDLTEKDKKVLYIVLLAVVVLIGVKFIIFPARDSYKEVKATNKTLVEQQDNMKSEIAKIDAYKKDLDTANSNYKKSTEKVFGNLKLSGIDEAITKTIMEMGLSPVALNITEINKVRIQAYTLPEVSSQLVDSQQNTTQEVTAGVVADTQALITAANVQITASGNEENVRALAMAMSDSEGIHIQALDIMMSGESSTLKATISMILSDDIG
ncbi:MAG: hypothetical protein EOM05_00175 [Clostridia bacterium]|nr:hypothetical protein [Clostridia bacterium]